VDVENLKAKLDVDARVSGLVEIRAGIVAEVGSLKMQLEGVESSTRLVVRLDNVTRILEHALEAVDENPDLATDGGARAAATPPPASEPPAEAGGPRIVSLREVPDAPAGSPILSRR
jgi:hypothetical protein